MFFTTAIDYLGAFAFCLSGASVGRTHRMDLFGILVMAMIAGFGGGCLRDLILNNSPPMVFRTPAYWIIACIASVLVFFIKKQHRYFDRIILVCDALGLAFFTIVGIRAGEAALLEPYQCVMMGVITASFGGVLRDVIVNEVPYVFRSEIYASLAIVGGVLYFVLKRDNSQEYVDIIIICSIFAMRMWAVFKKWNLPHA